jgi:imidazole glycerol-phosphate synthase subunit HisH
MRITIFDYGAGNLHSLAKAISTNLDTVTIEPDPLHAIDTDVLVLPGVGAFGAAAERLAPAREAMVRAVRAGLPTIGICLGMQLLFDDSDEGSGRGLGLLAGHVTRLRAGRVPQIGWNTIDDARDPLFETSPMEIAYYANSFVCRPRDESCIAAWSSHEGDRFPAAVRAGRTFGVQFHPEKSSQAGVRLLQAFLDSVRNTR